MAVPKSKVSKQRRNKRRSSVWKLETPGLTKCPKCGAYRLPHLHDLQWPRVRQGRDDRVKGQLNRQQKEEGETPLSFCMQFG